MKIREVMTNPVIRIRPEEPVAVAARTLARYNIGSLPVCGSDDRVCGLVTDRDIVTRCLAAGRSPASTTVADVMTGRVISAAPDMDTGVAAHLMGREQVRRLPVLEENKVVGMVSLGDLARSQRCDMEAGKALSEISEPVKKLYP